MVSWFFCLSNAVSCRGLGEIFSFSGLKGGDVCLINQNCHQMHFSNKLNNYLNLKRICWREIGHFAELRYFCPSAWPSQLLINKLLTVLVGWILRCISSSASDLVVQLRRPSQLGERSKRITVQIYASLESWAFAWALAAGVSVTIESGCGAQTGVEPQKLACEMTSSRLINP